MYYICKLVLTSFLMHPLKNTSLKIATIDGRNMWEVNDVYSVTNTHIFICPCWFYSHNFTYLSATSLIVSSKVFHLFRPLHLNLSLFLVSYFCSCLLHVVASLVCIFFLSHHLVLLSTFPKFLRSFCGQKWCTLLF